jgi:hypothetical protein
MRPALQDQTKECFVRMNWPVRPRWLGSSEIPPCFVNHEAVCWQLNSKEISREGASASGGGGGGYKEIEPKFWVLSIFTFICMFHIVLHSQ